MRKTENGRGGIRAVWNRDVVRTDQLLWRVVTTHRSVVHVVRVERTCFFVLPLDQLTFFGIHGSVSSQNCNARALHQMVGRLVIV